ncbi:GrpB family protein [Aspergillus alliaceus]|uniref:GrpB family protein n=1 Tax=Petromyces alliaceus TaxID=209559 RepID=UPI0012A5847F|nr:UPF0157-domain-containing protein [Aspergillus alliaceus]KAB8238171.1 UPF0157-domain-containing protein [Aspergillus alliaceus]
MAPSIEAIIKHYELDPSLIEKVSERREPNKIEIINPDPSWPQRYQLLKSRIETALGSRVLAITHIDAVDIDVTVTDPTDEASYFTLLEAAGFHFRTRQPHWHQHRFFSCYEPTANVHIFGPDCPEVVRHCLLREWLAKCPEDRELYAQTKRQAAKETIEAGERLAKYNLRKQSVIQEILERAFREAGYIQ